MYEAIVESVGQVVAQSGREPRDAEICGNSAIVVGGSD